MHKTYEPQNFNHLLGTNGFSDEMLQNHFKLYEGYVNNINKLGAKINSLIEEDNASTPEYGELKRRLGWEFNGMRLHELYFSNMSKESVEMDKESEIAKKIDEDFGSYEKWEKDFKATGSMRGIGWVILYYDTRADHLFNIWVNEHDMGNLVGCEPILVMDVFEHAFMRDYGLNRPDYVSAFFNAIDWEAVNGRFTM